MNIHPVWRASLDCICDGIQNLSLSMSILRFLSWSLAASTSVSILWMHFILVFKNYNREIIIMLKCSGCESGKFSKDSNPIDQRRGKTRKPTLLSSVLGLDSALLQVASVQSDCPINKTLVAAGTSRGCLLRRCEMEVTYKCNVVW